MALIEGAGELVRGAAGAALATNASVKADTAHRTEKCTIIYVLTGSGHHWPNG
jgi:uncharacterized RmlC-like cupin family protein